MAGDDGSIERIFNQAADLRDAKGRAAYLDEVCGADQELRVAVERLLKHDSDAGSFLAAPAVDFAAAAPTIDHPPAEQPGTMIGSYKLIEEIGEGGMGSVFMALQKAPVRRKVALKVIKPGMDSKQVISRFEAERQALAMMDHPNIARVFDGGATESGRPYFVMELVNGIPVTDYCDRYRLTTNDRLRLFGDVCRAVQHAHQKGIIHRDLKPSNILVTLLDGRAIPKVIDFGIAKAACGHLTEESLVTHFAQMIGSPLYMSPEQAELSGADVDTRSDVYSLGVLLYELLTGNTPFDRERMSSVSFDEFRRIIREEEPPPPSARLSTLDAALDTVADKHHTDPRILSHEVEGELDWIVMKTLEKDRMRRYGSANELAKDVERYLADEPVEACPPSVTYQLRKFIRRNRWPLVVAASMLLLVFTGTIGTTTGWIRATQAEAEARSDAVLEAQARAEAVRDRRRAKTLLARMQLQRGVDKLDSEDATGLLNLIDAWMTADENPELRAVVGRLWAIRQQGADGRLVHIFPGSRNIVAFSPDGKLLATATGNQTQLWDLTTGDAVGSPLPLEQPVTVALFSPDGKRLATCSSRGMTRLWNVRTRQPVGPPLRHETLRERAKVNVESLAAFSPDSKLLATGILDGSVRLWDATTGEPYGRPLHPEGPLSALTFGPDGRLLATGSLDGVAQLWDVATCQPQGKPLYDPLPERKVDVTIPEGLNDICRVAFSPDGSLLAVAYETDAAAVWDVETGELHSLPALLEEPARGFLHDLVFSPDGTRLATGSTDWTAQLWDVHTGKTIRSPMRHGGRVVSVAFTGDGKLLATGSHDGTLRLWDANSGLAHGPPLQQGEGVGRVLCSPDGRFVAAASWVDARVWRVNQRAAVPLRHAARMREPALSPDGRYRARITPQHAVEVVATATGSAAIDPIRLDAPPAAVAFSPNSRLLATGSWDFKARIWEVATGRLRQTLSCPGRNYAVAFSPDGKTLATGSRNGTLLLWDYAAGKKLGHPMRHPAPLWDVAFSPSGELLASFSGIRGRPGNLWFWDVTTGPHYVGLRAPHLTLAPDETLAALNLDGTLRLADRNGDSREWVLPEAPGELREMRLASWVALGLEQDLAGRVKAISSEKWRALREELNAHRQGPGPPDKMN